MLILELHIGHNKSSNIGGRVKIKVMAISYLVWAGVGRALLPSLLTAVTAAVIASMETSSSALANSPPPHSSLYHLQKFSHLCRSVVLCPEGTYFT